jgi:class 3 adenylate cyclase/tetratricopeptide (TPR) repeat protein
MADPDQLRRAIAAQEQLRGTLPDDVVDATIAALRAQLPPTEGRRTQVTVLFADVSGFTALSETRDAEVVMDLMNALWARLDAVVVDHGGRVDKHIGDALMAVWGTDGTREDDPERAVRTALRLQEALVDFRDSCGHEVAMRVGVNTGPALVGAVGTTAERTVIGDTVNVASRLEHAAPVGGVLIAHDTYRHVRGLFKVESLGPLAVKGKQDSVPAYVVHGARPRAFPIATRGVAGIETRTIGRDAELATLQRAYRETVATGAARIVTVVGEAGIGKSRLLWELDNWLELLPENVYYFAGRAYANRTRSPFALMRSVLTTRFDIIDSDDAPTVRAKVRAGFADVLDERDADLVAHWVGLDTGRGDAGHRLAGSADLPTVARAHLVAWFRTRAADRPVVMLLEDLHWADDESLELLTHLVEQVGDAPLLLVGATRPELLHRGTWPADHTVRLDVLSRDTTTALVREVLQRADDVPEELVQLISRRADGNAFFVEELVSMLIDEGVVVTDGGDDRWRIDVDRLDVERIPATLTAVLLARLDGLAPEQRRALQHAAVVGRIFWDAAVAALDPSDDVLSALAKTGERDFVHAREPSSFATASEYAFKHALLRDVTYETVLLRDRAPLHRAAAQWIESVAGDRIGEFRELIADHYLRADEPARAASELLAAGLAWRDQAHVGAARRALERAVQLSREAGVTMPESAAIAMGEVCYRLGDVDVAQETLDAVVERSDDPVTVAEALFWSSRIAEAAGDGPRERALLDRALDLLEPIGGVTHARVLAALTRWEGNHGDLDAATAIGERALRASEPDTVERTEAHSALGIIASLRGDADGADVHARLAADAARATGNLQLQASVLANLGVYAHLRGDDGDAAQYDVADAFYAESYALSRRIDMPSMIGVAALNRAQVNLRRGRLVEAAELVRESLGCSLRSGARVDMLFGVVIEADRRATIGDREGALELLRVATHDPSATTELHQEIERIAARLDVEVDDIGTRDPGDDLDATVAGILR